jgi:rhamnulokinase
VNRARLVAVDLGASSGRVYAVDIGADHLDLSEVARFANGGVPVGDRLYWDILRLHRGVLDGLAAAGRGGTVDSVGIDSWAVDYGLLRADGTLLANPSHHRDTRTAATYRRVVDTLGSAALYERTGIALHPFNTLYQLVADRDSGLLALADRALLVPDLLSYWLTGEAGTEITNASTTQLLDATGSWDDDLAGRLDLPSRLFAPLRRPGDPAGSLSAGVRKDLLLPAPVAVTVVASHDTASAVVAVPAERADFAYLSCGTWSLVGLELDRPLVTPDARDAGFTNERGIDGTIRFLRNVMGLWLLQEAVRTWERAGPPVDLAALTAAAGAAPPLRSVIDPDLPDLLTPGDMPARVAAACRAVGQPVPRSAAETTRCILDSLVLAYRRAISHATALTGRPVGVVHLVGGGVHNRLLCQLTADACGLPVVAGPVEAAAIGNALVQARALGVLDGDLPALRRFVARHTILERYEPDPDSARRFDDAAGARGDEARRAAASS